MGVDSGRHLRQKLETPANQEEKRYQEEQKAGKSVRERFEQLARISLAALALHASMPAGVDAQATPEQVAQTQRLLEKIPSSGEVKLSSGAIIRVPIAGTRFPQVNVHLPKNRAADKLVIVFRQQHLAEEDLLRFDNQREKRERLQNFHTSQTAIYEEIKDLASRGSLSKVCDEGVVDDTDVEELTEYYRTYMVEVTAEHVARYLPGSDIAQAVNRRTEIFADRYVDQQELKELKSHIDPIMKKYADEYKYVIGGAQIAAVDGLVSLCPAETRTTYDAAWDKTILNLEKKSDSTDEERASRRKKVYDDRDDAALRLALSQRHESIAISYGALHDFSHAVARWNTRNPDQQVVLVDVGKAE